MFSFLTCHRRRSKGQPQLSWKQIEDAAHDLESRPSWTAPDNTLLMQAFEWHVPDDKAHWRRLQHALPGLQAIGVDHIWIPPGCKAMNPSGNGYDIYDLYDLGEFDQKGARTTKWGTRQELEELVAHAQALGVGVYWDAVLNHKAGADYPERFKAVKVDPKRRDVEISDPVEVHGWVGFNFEGRGDQYSSLKYHWQHFSGVDWDDTRQENAIYKICGPNKGWASDVGQDNGNYDYLMFADLDYSHPEVREDVLRWGTWLQSVVPLKGMRLDAAKHFSTGFQKEFIDHMRQTAEGKFFVIGEYWSSDVRTLVRYLEEMEYRVSAVDVPLVENFSRMSKARGADLRQVFQGTLVQSKPDYALTFVANHDTQPGQMLENVVEPSFKPLAYALILLRQGGTPCVFYGDLYGINHGAHPMTPACEGKLPILMQARKLYAYGEQQDYFDQPNCVGFVRYGNATHPSGLACVLSTGGPAQKRMYVGRRHAGEQWTDLLRRQPGADDPPGATTVTIDAAGYGVFPVPGQVSVWVNGTAPGRDQMHQVPL
ncbi:alpha-amylase [Aspergillus ibericus CBS 121593]|uniref:Putative alpha-amylase n=1 Tax=Aspergillus ibericus CBS 121593 TaxID=1448316 RepID=A0A395H2S5_9EURO|nr:putative alpha-amylase [Aspergillus ibericus CBS 121593]RAL02187.1 putative alpha-amylase [Aspergillus ibericus CBS 121593]